MPKKLHQTNGHTPQNSDITISRQIPGKLLIEDYERSQSRHSVSCGGGSRAAVNKSMLVAGHGRAEWFTSGTGYGRQHSGSRWLQMETMAHNIHDVMSSSAIM